MEIAFANILPVFKIDAEFESRLGRAHELGLTDTQQTVEQGHWRNCAFAHADGADGIGFDKRQFNGITQCPRERSSGHPACGATPRYHHAQLFGVSHHRLKVLSKKARNRPAVSAVSGSRTPRAPGRICSDDCGVLAKT